MKYQVLYIGLYTRTLVLPLSHTCLSRAPCIYVDFSSLLETRPLGRAHALSPHFKLIPLAHTLFVSLSHMHSVLLLSPSLSHTHNTHTHGLFATTSKMPMRCTEHQDAFVWVVYLVGEKDEWGKALFANVERGVGIFLQNCHSFLPIRQIWIGRPTLQDGRQTIVTNSVFLSLLL